MPSAHHQYTDVFSLGAQAGLGLDVDFGVVRPENRHLYPFDSFLRGHPAYKPRRGHAIPTGNRELDEEFSQYWISGVDQRLQRWVEGGCRRYRLFLLESDEVEFEPLELVEARKLRKHPAPPSSPNVDEAEFAAVVARELDRRARLAAFKAKAEAAGSWRETNGQKAHSIPFARSSSNSTISSFDSLPPYDEPESISYPDIVPGSPADDDHSIIIMQDLTEDGVKLPTGWNDPESPLCFAPRSAWVGHAEL